MNITNTPAVPTANSGSLNVSSDSLNILVLKKALDVQAAAAMALIQALPRSPNASVLATQGSLGTRVSAFV
jgi:hypothetical protein